MIRAIGEHPNLLHAGTNVKLSISSTCLALKLLDNDVVIAMHDMPRISFASGGDAVCRFNYETLLLRTSLSDLRVLMHSSIS